MLIAPASVELSPSPDPVGSFTHHSQTQHSSIYINKNKINLFKKKNYIKMGIGAGTDFLMREFA